MQTRVRLVTKRDTRTLPRYRPRHSLGHPPSVIPPDNRS